MPLASGFLSYAFTFFFTSVALYFWSLVRLPGFRSFVVVMQKASVGSDEAAGLRLYVTREAVLEAAGGLLLVRPMGQIYRWCLLSLMRHRSMPWYLRGHWRVAK